MSSRKAAQTADALQQLHPAAQTQDGGKKRTRKAKGAQWYRVDFPDGKYRVIQGNDPMAVMGRVANISPAGPTDFAQAGKDGVELEHQPITAQGA